MGKLKVFFLIDFECLEKLEKVEGKILKLENFLNDLVSNPEIDLFFDKEITESLSDEDITEYFETNITSLSSLIINAEAWQFNPVFDKSDKVKFYQWQFGNTEEVINIIAEIAERQIVYEEYCFLLNCCLDNKNNLYVIRDNLAEFPNNSYWTRIEKADCLDEESFRLWVNKFRQKRIFKHHPKHDKAKRKNNKAETVSVLLCDEEKAQILLFDAIGGNSQNNKTLYNYDIEEQFYIVFMHEEYKPEIDTNIYHGFHREDTNDFLNGIKKDDNELFKKLEKLKGK